MSNWVSISTTAGTGDTILTITAATNEELFERMTTLRAETTIQHKTADANILQKRYRPYDYIDPEPDYVSFDPTGGTETIEVEASVDWEVCSICKEGDVNTEPNTGYPLTTILSGTFVVQKTNTDCRVCSGEDFAYPYRIDGGSWVLPTDSSYPKPTTGSYRLTVSFPDTTPHVFEMDLERPYKRYQLVGYNYEWREIDIDDVKYTDIYFNVYGDRVSWLSIAFPNILVEKPGGVYPIANEVEFMDGFTTPGAIKTSHTGRFRDPGVCVVGSRDTLERIVFGEGIETIPNGYLAGVNETYCYANLVYVYLPTTLKTIGERAFMNCTSLPNLWSTVYTASGVTIPEGIETIGEGAFANTAFVGELKLPSTLRKVGNTGFYNVASAYYYTTGITSIVLGPYTRDLSYDAFKGYPNATNIRIPCYSAPRIKQSLEGLNQNGTLHYPVYGVNMYGNLKNMFPSGWDFIMDITDNWIWEIGL